MERFKDQVVLITGAGSGIGRATAIRFAREGASCVIADLDGSRAESTAAEIVSNGGQTLTLQVDVANAHACEYMVESTLARFGRLDVVVPNAGVSISGLVKDMATDIWERVISINLNGVFLTCKFAIPSLIESDHGAIVTIGSSMAGWDSSASGAAYMASKEGVTGLTKSLALQLGRHRIRVNSVCPGVIRTQLGMEPGMTGADLNAKYDTFARRVPLGRVGLPEDVAAAVAFLASSDASHISGALLLIDGGQTLQSWSNAPMSETYPATGSW